MTVAAGGIKIAHIAQGEHATGCEPDAVIGAILGSCIAACVWDPEVHVGGMNHILLPDSTTARLEIHGHGACAMERLINALLRQGASKSRLRAKVFGGANMIVGLPDIGRRNIEFVTQYLAREGIPIEGSSVGGYQARMLRFWPWSGRARQRLVDRVEEEVRAPLQAGNEVELF